LKRSEERVIACGLGDDFIAAVAERLMERCRGEVKDFGRIAVVFGGRRPALFLNRELSRRIEKSFCPPRYFSMDEFIRYVATRDEAAKGIAPLDACYCLYELVKECAPDMARGRAEFSQFLPWAEEIAAFIDLLDLEGVDAAKLKNVQEIAAIGYDVPESANALLMRIASLRDGYHRALREKKTLSRGLMYLLASRRVGEMSLPEFDAILFCNLFRLHETEAAVVKCLYEKGTALLFFQGDDREWGALKKLSRLFGCEIRPAQRPARKPNLSVLAGFDTQSQAALVREILTEMEPENRRETVVVLPESESLIPLLSEVAECAEEFNVSMGYPLKRSALHSLLQAVISAQATRRGNSYYAKDYLKVITHPLLKNMTALCEPAVTRVLVHKVEEILSGGIESPISGSLFITLEEVEGCEAVYREAAATLRQMEIAIDPGELPGVLAALHEVAFAIWEGIGCMRELATALERFVGALADKTRLCRYFVNLKIAERMLSLGEELSVAAFAGAPFPQEELFRIFTRMIEKEMISFSGSPLAGLQVLGLMETRALNFRNVIIMDLNETALPKLRVCEPLIPRQVMVSLGLNRLEDEEEIQRYQFMRLLAGAERAHLVYDDSPEKERSRLIEELVWERQKDEGALSVLPVTRAVFRTDMAQRRIPLTKDERVVEFLEGMNYSPTSLNAYIECPAGFYYRYVLGLKEREDLLGDPEGSDVGIFIHDLLKGAFKQFLGARPNIDGRFRAEFLKEMERRFADVFAKRMRSDAFMLEYVIRSRLESFLNSEAGRDVKELLAIEEGMIGSVACGGRRVAVTCRVDRIDRLGDDSLLIVDYKTGAIGKRPRARAILEMSDLSRETIRDAVCSFQLPLCYHLAKVRYGEERAGTALYDLRSAQLIEFPGKRDAERCDEVMAKCMTALAAVAAEIANPEIPFVADDGDKARCSRCPFFYMCK
jgi:hypothetical protein